MFSLNFRSAAFVLGLAVAGCGTTYQLAAIDASTNTQAKAMFDASAAEGPRSPASASAARARFERVVRRVRPVAEAFCLQELATTSPDACNVSISLDLNRDDRNAYFFYGDGLRKKDPTIKVTLPLLRDIRNDHELAFVLGHEYGHLLGQHLQKQEQQAIAGMLLAGVVAAAATQGAANSGDIVADSVDIGGQIGQRAFSQTYELESDTIGTLIAHQAGFDPVIGAQFFARPSEVGRTEGQLSFWGTHPPDAKRIATVMATVSQLESRGGISRKAP